jgi:hypothetical protein
MLRKPWLYIIVIAFCNWQPSYCQTHAIDSLKYRVLIAENNKKNLTQFLPFVPKGIHFLQTLYINMQALRKH